MTYTKDRPLRVFSFGGGVQSTAVMALQALGELPQAYDAFLFANVGEDSENPDTLTYVQDYAIPFCEEFDIPFIEVRKHTHGKPDSVLQSIHRKQRSIDIPVRMANGAPGHRTCTTHFKIAVVDKWIREQNVSHAVTGLGISLDEIHRMRDEDWHDEHSGLKFGFMKRRDYPLIDLLLRRDDCKQIIERVGLPVPPKSSCYFCPFQTRHQWQEMKRTQPALFQKAVEIETHINEKRDRLGKDHVYLHPSCTPLDQAVGDQLRLPFMRDFDEMEAEACGGYCHT